MYTAYFGLEQAPFSIAPDPRYLYMSHRHREALAHLVYGLQAGGGFVLLTGEIGSGKTTICRCLLEQTPANCQIAYIFNPKLSVVELLQSICEEFRVALPDEPHSVKSLLGPLNAFLLQAHGNGRNCVLIIDEAQNLSADVLEQLRLLTNLETSERKLLQIILIGQPELRTLLERPELEQLAQRVIARYHLQALDQTQTRQYIQHRLMVAGLKATPPFTNAAMLRLHKLAQGVPRRINLLCDRALLGAYAKRSPKVDVELVEQAGAEVLGRSIAHPWRKPLVWTAGTLGALVIASAAWVSNPEALTINQTVKATDNRPLITAPNPPTITPPAASEAPDLSSLPQGENLAWQALGLRWGLQLPSSDICKAALAESVQCFRTSQLTLAGLQQLDRPGLLLLSDHGVSRWVLAEALHEGRLTVRSGDVQWTLSLEALQAQWQGQYNSLWRLPPGHRDRIFSASEHDTAGQWLTRQLASLDAEAPKDLAFSARVSAFQQKHGLHGNGRALPSTFLLVNRLSGVDEPRLLTAAAR